MKIESSKSPYISIVIPVYNEEAHIEHCLESVMSQSLPAGSFELIIVDGMSSDNTRQIVSQFASQSSVSITLLENPRRTQAVGFNLGAAAAEGEYLVRMDAHSDYPPQYVARCVELLIEKGVQNAGCACVTVGRTKTGKAIAKLLTSSFAVGGSSFRVGAESGYVDTVPFGTFRRDYFLSIGGFDERLVRSEDNELNSRIRRLGGKIYMTSDLHATYYCRETIPSLAKMAFNNGKWNVLAAHLLPGSISLKYFVPFAFLLSLIIMPALCFLSPVFCWLFALELLLYFGLAFLSAIKKSNSIVELPLLLLLFPIFHLCYGAGSLVGLLSIVFGKAPKRIRKIG